MKKLQDLTLKEFLEKTAANEAVPGGGSTAALTAAIAAALGEMVANLTIGKKHYVGVEERMRELATELHACRSRFVNDIDRDAEAYRLVMEAYRLPKEDEAAKRLRSDRIGEAMETAARVPMEVAEKAFEMLHLLAEAIGKGNCNAVTDGLVGAMACRTAIMGALLNVRINLGGIRDDLLVQALASKCDRLEEETTAMEQELIALVKTQL